MKHSLPLTSLCIGLLAIAAPAVKAGLSDQKTIVTFSEPVEIPGQVLPTGTYVFRLVDSAADRDIVQVFNKDGDHLYGTFVTIPDYRLEPAGKIMISFDERPSGEPEVLKGWFYPGENYCHEFVYPKSRAVALARINKQPIPSMPTEMTATTTTPTRSVTQSQVAAMKETPLKAQEPTGEAVEITQVFAVAQALAPLPGTARSLPLLGLLGLLFLGLVLRLQANDYKKQIDRLRTPIR